MSGKLPEKKPVDLASRPLDQLIDEVRLMWNVLVERGEKLHADEPVTMGMRAVLEFLGRNGPTSVPNIARSRHVSRQHIQVQVNALLGEGLVEPYENPAHKRSSLVALSTDGKRLLARMRRRELAILDEASGASSDQQILRAAGVLRALREALRDE